MENYFTVTLMGFNSGCRDESCIPGGQVLVSGYMLELLSPEV